MYVFIGIFTELWGAGFESFSKQLMYIRHISIYKSNIRVGFYSEFWYLCLHRVKTYLDLHFNLELRIVFIHVLFCLLPRAWCFLQKPHFFIGANTHLLFTGKPTLFYVEVEKYSLLLRTRDVFQNTSDVILGWKHTNICNICAFIFRCFRYYKGSK